MLLYERLKKKKKKRHMAILFLSYCTQNYLQSTLAKLSAGHQTPQQHQNEDYMVIAMQYTIKDNPSVQNRDTFISLSFGIHQHWHIHHIYIRQTSCVCVSVCLSFQDHTHTQLSGVFYTPNIEELFCFLGPHPQHVEVPGQGSNQKCSCWPTAEPQQCRI